MGGQAAQSIKSPSPLLEEPIRRNFEKSKLRNHSATRGEDKDCLGLRNSNKEPASDEQSSQQNLVSLEEVEELFENSCSGSDSERSKPP